MTRETEIEQQTFVYYETCSDEDIAKSKGFIDGAKWADQHPKEGLVEVKKVEQWITSCFAFLNDAGHHHFKVDKFIENFRKAMEE